MKRFGWNFTFISGFQNIPWNYPPTTRKCNGIFLEIIGLFSQFLRTEPKLHKLPKSDIISPARKRHFSAQTLSIFHFKKWNIFFLYNYVSVNTTKKSHSSSFVFLSFRTRNKKSLEIFLFFHLETVVVTNTIFFLIIFFLRIFLFRNHLMSTICVLERTLCDEFKFRHEKTESKKKN
jgi:hypothetical protein